MIQYNESEFRVDKASLFNPTPGVLNISGGYQCSTSLNLANIMEFDTREWDDFLSNKLVI